MERVKAVARTEEITMGLKERSRKSPRITSRAKMAPAMGALKVAEMPAAAPQPTRIFMCWAEMRKSWPRLEPRVEPIWTMGPSLPTEPPEPMQMAEARILTRATRGRIRPPWVATAAITSGTP
jgi:hypothetical protein